MPDGGTIAAQALGHLPGAVAKPKPKALLRMPTLHTGQYNAFKQPGWPHKAIRCGRRWGKSALGTCVAVSRSTQGQPVGFFAPDYKRLSEIYTEIAGILAPVTTQASQNAGMIRLRTGGQVEFWTLEDDNAGRSRKYKTVLLDEAAFGKDNLTDIWERSIEPTLFDYSGTALVMSNTNGISEENFFWRICNMPEKYNFSQYHAPTHDNPLLPLIRAGETHEAWLVRRAEAFATLEREKPPLVYAQEHLANFVDFSGAAFFNRDKLLLNGAPVPDPGMVDVIFATIDTAVKDGQEHDSTAVVYWGKSAIGGVPLTILDWDILQIEGSLLEEWLPTVYQTMKQLEVERANGGRGIRVRLGHAGTFIEDKGSGTILLQQAARRGWEAHPIESELTALGKDARAISVSGYVHQDKVKITQYAYDKTVALKGVTRNHLLSQIANFKVGDKDAKKRADDLTDCFTYGIAVGLGNADGF
jgi:hypothetical protein